MAEISLKVEVASRQYPLTIKEEDELLVINAETMLKDKMKELGQRYGIHDKQDLLAMSALHLIVAAQAVPTVPKSKAAEQELLRIDAFVADYLAEQ